MKNLRNYLLLLLLFAFFTSTAQNQANALGSKYTIASKVLNKNKEIKVYLPDNYKSSKNKYPVLYIIDGQWYFPLGVGISNMLTQFKGASITPQFIIVGIVNSPSARYRTLVSEKDKYAQFLEKEVIPLIESKFRTSKERFLFGWQFAGSFALRLMGTNPTLFKAYFAADPYPLMTKFDTDLKDLYETLPKVMQFDNFMYCAVGQHGETVIEGAEYLSSFLEKINSKVKGLKWQYQELLGEEHRSTPFAALYRGLKNYYHNYDHLQLHSYEEYKRKGGLEYFRNYYKARAQRFGFKAEIPSWPLFTLIRSTMRANKTDHYDWLMQDFEAENFTEKASIYEILSVLNHYRRNNQTARALKYYKILDKKHPNSARVQNAIGEAYFALNNNEEAKKHYMKAVALGEKQKDRRLATYKKNLAKVRNN